jgi:hypothetical protein
LLGGIGLDLIAAVLAPYDEPEARQRGTAYRHRRSRLGFHPRRRLLGVARGGAYTFGGGKGSRVGSGRILPRIALSI